MYFHQIIRLSRFSDNNFKSYCSIYKYIIICGNGHGRIKQIIEWTCKLKAATNTTIHRLINDYDRVNLGDSKLFKRNNSGYKTGYQFKYYTVWDFVRYDEISEHFVRYPGQS